MIRAATCFSGIGAPEVGMPGWDWAWCAEIEPFPCAVMAARHPKSINLGDVLADDFIARARAMGPIDVLAGGPPCQGFSLAGLRGGLSDPRGNLSLRWVQICHAIQPRNAVTENVPGWLSMPDNAFGCFLGATVGADDALLPCERPAVGKSNTGWKWRAATRAYMLRELGDDGLPVYLTADELADLEASDWQEVELDARHIPVWPSSGMASGPRARCAWRILDAQYFGLAQRRRRVFVVTDFGNGADPAKVLFERVGLLGNSPPRRETGEEVAPTLVARTKSGGGPGTDFDLSGGLIVDGPQSGARDGGLNDGIPDVALCLNAGAMGRIDAESETMIPVLQAFTITERGRDGGSNLEFRQDGTANTILTPNGGRGGMGVGAVVAPPCYGLSTQQEPKWAEEISPTLALPSKSGGGQLTSVCHPIAFSSKDYGNDATADLSPTLRAMGHDGSHANGGGQMAVAIRTAQTGANGYGFSDEVAHTIDQTQGQAVAFAQNQRDELRLMDVAGALSADPGMKQTTYINQGWAVRRLTVKECERLQGFPDDFTAITYRGKPAADGPRYKSLGNSWAVPVGRWALSRVEEFMPE